MFSELTRVQLFSAIALIYVHILQRNGKSM